MKYIWANFITSIKDWSCVLIENWNLTWVSLDKLDSFKFSPYLSDLILYSIQSKKQGKQSSLFPNLYEKDLIKITKSARDTFKNYFSLTNFYESINFEGKNIINYKNKHAYYHVLWTHFSSPFNDSVWICIDYLWYNDFWNHQVQTIWKCGKNNIDLLDDFDTSLTINRWIWFTYSIFADFFDIYKYDIAFLVPYWNKNLFSWIELYEYKDGNVFLKKDFLYWVSLQADLLPKTFYASIEEIPWNMDAIYSNIKRIFNINDKQINDAHKDLKKWIIANLLAYVHDETRKACLFLTNKAYELWNSKNLTISGWLASNHLLCNEIVNKSRFKNFYFEVSPNYTGISVWAAFELYKKSIYLEKTWYWKQYSNEDIFITLSNYSNYLSFDLLSDIEQQNNLIIDKLKNKKIIWYFKAGSELWPRALWNRSILSICDCEDLSDKIRSIKKKQNWKSFSISILENELWTYFEDNHKSIFMSLSSKLKDKYKKDFVWVNFDNNIIRYQSIWENNNRFLYDLLCSYSKVTWKPFLLNTSLNSFKQSIVECPKQAIELFLSTDIDYLVLWDFIVSKDKTYEKFSFDYEKVKTQKNIDYFSTNKDSYKNYVSIKTILEKLFFKWCEFNISNIKYFETTIDLDFFWNKISIEKLNSWKKYDMKTNNVWIKIFKLESRKELIIFYKKLKLLDYKFESIFSKWEYFLKDLTNYL